MNIYAPKGTRVVYTGENGSNSDKAFANSVLEVGKEYVVWNTDVQDWYTNVYLLGIDGKFNSVMFGHPTFPYDENICDLICGAMRFVWNVEHGYLSSYRTYTECRNALIKMDIMVDVT